jgi:small subunit ribosomal protein S19
VAKKFNYRGIPDEKLESMSVEEFVEHASARVRRTIKRGFNPFQKRLLEKVREAKRTGSDKPIKTQCRDMPVVPAMIGLTLRVHNGREYVPVTITAEKVGHFLGEFASTRQRIKHSAPGVGATRSSKFIPLK